VRAATRLRIRTMTRLSSTIPKQIKALNSDIKYNELFARLLQHFSANVHYFVLFRYCNIWLIMFLEKMEVKMSVRGQ
jgi:hypothetical protein